MHKYLHIRQYDVDTLELSSTGGITLAYTANKDIDGIFISLAQCSQRDQFSRKIGRELASKRLYEDGPLDVINFSNPVSESVRRWVQEWFNISLIQDGKGRWISDFITPDYEGLSLELGDDCHEFTRM